MEDPSLINMSSSQVTQSERMKKVSNVLITLLLVGRESLRRQGC